MSDHGPPKKPTAEMFKALEAAVPRPKSPSLSIDTAEFIALRVVVGILIGVLGKKEEVLTGQPAGQFLNSLSALCQEALLNATFDGPLDADKLRRDAIEHVNKIVGTVRFDDDRTGSN
jgi:hypothetical protein